MRITSQSARCFVTIMQNIEDAPPIDWANVRESDTTRRTTQTMSTENQTPANPKPSPAGQCGSLSVIAGSESVACAATPRDELLRQILDSRIPKNEREWCAAREIEELRKGLAAALALIEDSYGVAGLHLNGDVAPWHELRTGGRYEDWLFDFDQAVKRLPPNESALPLAGRNRHQNHE